MPLTKSKGNMYSWVTHMHSHLGGECHHGCSYCYVGSRGRSPKYRGPLRLIEKELKVRYKSGKTIFVEHCNDFLAAATSEGLIRTIINHCLEWPDNIYVFQTKNPARYFEFLDLFPKNSILGTTIETNRYYPSIMGKAPTPYERAQAIAKLPGRKFVTIEPVLDFDVYILAGWISIIKPDFLNLGADSKWHNLPEPPIEKIFQLVEELGKYDIELREKHNLERLKEKCVGGKERKI